MRAFAETTAAQREPFAAGVERLPGLDPVYWHGAARDGFARRRDGLTGHWRTVLDTHDEVLRRVDGHSSFVHQLQHLWEADRGDPLALHHTAELHRAAAAELAAMLLDRAARLDAVAPRQAPPESPPPATTPRPTAGPGRTGAVPAKSEPHPTPEPHATPTPEPALEAGATPEPALEAEARPGTGGFAGEPEGSPATPAHRYLLTEQLGEQLVLGRRLHRIRWEADR